MDWQQHMREVAAWLVHMASLPGRFALEHAKHREAELIASSHLYADLPEYVQRARLAAKEPSDAPR